MSDRGTIERLIRSAYAARVNGDLDGVMRHFSDDAVFSLVGSAGASPVPLTTTGIALIREVLGRLVASFAFVAAELVTLIVEGDQAAAVWRVRIRPAGDGSEVVTEVVDIMRFEGERIASFRQFADTALAARLLGQ